MTLELIHFDSDIDSHSPSIAPVPQNFSLFEDLVFGLYTLQLWCSPPSMSHCNFVVSRPSQTRVRFASYLPQGTNGVSIPKFNASFSGDSHTMAPRNVKPIGKDRRSLSESPWQQKNDPSDYVSPFAKPPFMHSTSLPVLKPHPSNEKIIPGFVLNTPDSFMWSCIIYKNGIQIDPSDEPELLYFSWVKKDGSSAWSQKTFTKSELVLLLHDLFELSERGQEVETEIAAETPEILSKHHISERKTYEELSNSHFSTSFTVLIEPEKVKEDEVAKPATPEKENESPIILSEKYISSEPARPLTALCDKTANESKPDIFQMPATWNSIIDFPKWMERELHSLEAF